MMNIAALLSGGVDSSVVVHLLCEQGYKPTLFYIKIGMDGAEYMDCSAEEDIEMSTAIAVSYKHLRDHETTLNIECHLMLEIVVD